MSAKKDAPNTDENKTEAAAVIEESPNKLVLLRIKNNAHAPLTRYGVHMPKGKEIFEEMTMERGQDFAARINGNAELSFIEIQILTDDERKKLDEELAKRNGERMAERKKKATAKAQAAKNKKATG